MGHELVAVVSYVRKYSWLVPGLWVFSLGYDSTVTGIFPALMASTIYPSIQGFCADSGYRGTFEEEVRAKLGLHVEIKSRNKGEKWQILPQRWIVERTFAWLNNSRRLSKDYEKTVFSGEAMLQLSHIHTLLKRL